MDGETLKADGGDFEGRVKQLEINQSNLFMVLNANNILGVTANLLLVEDFVKCDCTDRATKTCDVDKYMIRYNSLDSFSETFAKIGRDYTVVWKGLDHEIQINDILDGNNSDDERAFMYYFAGDLSDWLDTAPNQASDAHNPRNNAKLYRTTAGIVTGKYAYGPGNLFDAGFFHKLWDGKSSTQKRTYTLKTEPFYANRFRISVDEDGNPEGELTDDGYFTLA